MNVIESIWDNRQWIFSGIGVLILTGIWQLCIRLSRARGGKAVTKLEPLSAIIASDLSPRGMIDTIKAALPLAREHVGQQFVGIPVEWDLPFWDARKRDDGTVSLWFDFPDEGVSVSQVLCSVDFAANGFLRSIHRGTKLRVRGVIEKVEGICIILCDASLSIPQ